MPSIPTTSELTRYAVEQLALVCCTEEEIKTFKWENGRLVGPAPQELLPKKGRGK
jgi:hypothetical protein